MKTTITPEMDTMIERILSGTERETFRIPSTCDGCNWYRIEMNAIYQKIDELNVFPDFSYEADMGLNLYITMIPRELLQLKIQNQME